MPVLTVALKSKSSKCVEMVFSKSILGSKKSLYDWGSSRSLVNWLIKLLPDAKVFVHDVLLQTSVSSMVYYMLGSE